MLLFPIRLRITYKLRCLLPRCGWYRGDVHDYAMRIRVKRKEVFPKILELWMKRRIDFRSVTMVHSDSL